MKRTALTIAALFAAAPAFAQADFASMDADGSGTVTYEEVASVMNVEREAFDAADTDASGDLSEEEFTALEGTTTQ